MEGEQTINKTVLGMAAVALILIIVAFLQGGLPLVGEGFLLGGQKLLEVIPLIIIAFILAGLVSISIPKRFVSKWLGREAGWKGPFLGSLVGAMVPGGPFFFYPLMATLTLAGANVGTMISFVAAKTLWNFARIPLEIAFVGAELTLIRFVITFPIPILAGAAVDFFLPGIAEKIREDIRRLQRKNSPLKSGEEID
jgi:uncharacterized protein